ncbi:MAG: hypothetical protein ACLSDQ_06155 [Adlercreutzia equolifaciens]
MAVNRNGVRFTNESLPYDNICNASALQPGGVFCQVSTATLPPTSTASLRPDARDSPLTAFARERASTSCALRLWSPAS